MKRTVAKLVKTETYGLILVWSFELPCWCTIIEFGREICTQTHGNLTNRHEIGIDGIWSAGAGSLDVVGDSSEFSPNGYWDFLIAAAKLHVGKCGESEPKMSEIIILTHENSLAKTAEAPPRILMCWGAAGFCIPLLSLFQGICPCSIIHPTIGNFFRTKLSCVTYFPLRFCSFSISASLFLTRNKLHLGEDELHPERVKAVRISILGTSARVGMQLGEGSAVGCGLRSFLAFPSISLSFGTLLVCFVHETYRTALCYQRPCYVQRAIWGKKNAKSENALTLLIFKIMSSEFQDFLFDYNSSISEVFCHREHSRRVHDCTTTL